MKLGFTLVGVAVLMSGVVSGCAQFDDSASSPFTPVPSQRLANPKPPQTPPTTTSPRPLKPCEDADKAVVGTCLDATAGLVVLDPNAGLVSERRTGRIMKVVAEQKPSELMRVPVDASGDGGLLDIALSPDYREDGLIYAYITTESDNRVVRIAKGDAPKPILTGIPKGPVGNNGAITFVNDTELLVLTGDAGNPAAAADPGSLAGKVLRLRNPRPGGTAPPMVAMSGIGVAGGLCLDPKGNIWVTDRTATQDRLQRITADGKVISPVWTWPDRPGVAGCAASADQVAIAMTGAKAVALAPVDQKTFAISTPPNLIVQNRYGALNGAAMGPDGLVWVGTVNKLGDKPAPTDDRVIKIPVAGGAGGGPD